MQQNYQEEKIIDIRRIYSRFFNNKRRLFVLMNIVNRLENFYWEEVKNSEEESSSKKEFLLPIETVSNDLLMQRHKELTQKQIDEVVRVSIVFFHAIFEDAIREFVRFKLVQDPIKALTIVYPSKNISLSDLMNYRDENIDVFCKRVIFENLGLEGDLDEFDVQSLINQAIDKYLARQSVNSIKDLIKILDKVDISSENLPQACFSLLSKMMKRRHKIVHQADLENELSETPTEISIEVVDEWIDTVSSIIDALFMQELINLGFLQGGKIYMERDIVL